MMESQPRSLFKYEFVAFFTWWWGAALLYLSYQSQEYVPGSPYLSYLILGIILLAIGLYSLISRARVVMEDRKRLAPTGTITP